MPATEHSCMNFHSIHCKIHILSLNTKRSTGTRETNISTVASKIGLQLTVLVLTTCISYRDRTRALYLVNLSSIVTAARLCRLLDRLCSS